LHWSLYGVGLPRPTSVQDQGQCCDVFGSVVWINEAKGYGFIRPDHGGADVFCHCRAAQQAGLRLTEGLRLIFDLAPGAGKNSRPQAVNLQLVD
jgi:cold shock protein